MRYLVLPFMLLSGCLLPAQFSDDMENYTVGVRIFEDHWTDFNCGGSCAIYASDAVSHGGLISGLIPDDMTTDGVLNLGNKIFDVWHLEFWMHVPSGKEAFFTILSNVPYEPPNIGLFYFNLDNNSPGQGIINDIAVGDVSFTFPHDEWFSIKFTVDITSGITESTWQLFIDDIELIPCGTPFSTESGIYPTSLGGIEFYSFSNLSTFYLDDFLYENSPFACKLGLENHLLEKINIYPNPVANLLTIQNQNRLVIESVILYDTLGRKVLESKKATESIDVSNLTAGVYFIHIATDSGNVTKKIIKE